jgi:hypothetical protein
MQPLKAIHIVKSLQPTQTPKLAKEYVFPYAGKRGQRISTCGNSRFAKAGVSCFNDSKVINSSFVLLMKFSAKNPRLRKAAKRYASP